MDRDSRVTAGRALVREAPRPGEGLVRPADGAPRAPRRRLDPQWLLSLPGFLFFAVFFVAPAIALLAIALNPSVLGVITFQPELTLENFVRFFTTSTYYMAAVRSFVLTLLVVLSTLALGYPLAYLVAKTEHPGGTPSS